MKQAGSHSTISAVDGVAVTKSDTTVLTLTRALYIGVSGDVAVKFKDNSTAVVFVGVPIGILPVQVVQVMSTNTTASSMVALY